MRAITKKHSSVHNGKSRFAQVTVAAFAPEEEESRPAVPELFLNDFRINRLTSEDAKLVDVAVSAVRETEATLGWSGSPLCVTRVESSYINRDPETARIAATSAATSLIQGA